MQHVVSIVLMVNEKCRQRVPGWDVFASGPADKFSAFFARVLAEALYVRGSSRQQPCSRFRS